MGASIVIESQRWRRSSHSASGSECVELAHTLDAIRDSKNPAVTLTVPSVEVLLAALRGGQPD